MKIKSALDRYALPALFFFALVYSLWAAQVGWWNSIMDEHHFRQTQTAMSAFYMMHGGPFWKYETPLFGPPWSIPFEFPLYQWLIAVLAGHSSIPLEQAGRLIGKFFYFAALFPIWSILGSLSIPKARRFLFLTLYLLSPMYLYWSRCLLIESTALFFSLAYLALVGKVFLGSHRKASLFLAALLGALAGVLKVTTFAGFLMAAGIWFLHSIEKSEWRALPKIKKSRLFDILCCFLVPVICTLAWTHFADAQKHLNPLSEFITSERLSKWNFGTFHQRISQDTWYMFFRKTIHDAIGHRTTWMLSLVSMLVLRKRWKLYLLGTFLFLLAPMTFTNLHIAHNYYWYANGIFLVFSLGISILAMLEAEKFWPVLGAILLLVSIALSVRQYQRFFFYSQSVDNGGLAKDGAAIGHLIPEDGVLLIYGWDWYPGLPYYTQRRCIMNRENLDLRSQEMKSILSALPPYRLTHMALCNRIGTKEFLAKLAEQGLQAKLVSRQSCDVYQVNLTPAPEATKH